MDGVPRPGDEGEVEIRLGRPDTLDDLISRSRLLLVISVGSVDFDVISIGDLRSVIVLNVVDFKLWYYSATNNRGGGTGREWI